MHATFSKLAKGSHFRQHSQTNIAGDFEFTARMRFPQQGGREVWAGPFGQNAKVRVQACSPAVVTRPICPPMSEFPGAANRSNARDKWQNSLRGCMAAQDSPSASGQGHRHYGSPQVPRGRSGGSPYHPSTAVGARRADGAHANHGHGTGRAAYALFDAGDAGAHPSWRFLHRFACAFGECAHIAQLVLPETGEAASVIRAAASSPSASKAWSPHSRLTAAASPRRRDDSL